MAVAGRMVADHTVVAGRPAVSAGGARQVEAVVMYPPEAAMLPVVAEATRPAVGVGIPPAVGIAVATKKLIYCRQQAPSFGDGVFFERFV